MPTPNTSAFPFAALLLALAGNTLAADNPVLDWVPLEALNDEQRSTLPPGSCGAYITPMRTDEDAQLAPDAAPIRASADQSSLIRNDDANQQLLLIGDVVVTQGYRRLLVDRAELNQANNELIVEGNLEVREPGLLVLGDKIRISQQGQTLDIDNTTYVLHQQNLRGSAAAMSKPEGNRLILSDADFTRCEPGNNTWLLKGSQIILDADSRQGHAKHVRLLVKGVPIFYFPYLRFPLGDQRLSGFLAPTVSYDDDGSSLSLPFYFNLAPNYDWLFTPHFLEAHGVLYENNLRHLNRHFYTQLNLAYLNDDKGEIGENDQQLIDDGLITEAQAVPFRGEDRWLINVDQIGGEGRAWSTQIDYTKVSDIDFFRDFDTAATSANDNYVDQKLLTGYSAGNWQFDLDSIRYQTLSDTITTPYQQLPALSATGNYRWGNWALGLDHQWVSFDHEDADSPNPTLTGDRLRTDYRLAWEYEPEWGFFRPAAQLKHLQYRFDDNNFAADAEQSPSLTAPQLVLDTGLFFERDGSGYLQTFEPRLFYFYSDIADHNALFDVTTDGQDVDFDTSELTFSYSQLFLDSRFSGGDRIDDANQLTVGLTTRFIGNTSGREWFSASIGQITYFDDRRVNLTNITRTSEKSAIAAQISSNPGDSWRITSDWLYDDQNNELDKASIGLRYQNTNRHLFDLDYRYTRGSAPALDTKQYNLAVITPLFNERWHLLLYSAYDAANSRELESLSAVEYNGCCYRLRLGYRSELDDRFADSLSDDQLEYDYSVFLELHLKGLGGTSKQLDSLLDENIDGYREWQAIYHPDN